MDEIEFAERVENYLMTIDRVDPKTREKTGNMVWMAEDINFLRSLYLFWTISYSWKFVEEQINVAFDNEAFMHEIYRNVSIKRIKECLYERGYNFQTGEFKKKD